MKKFFKWLVTRWYFYLLTMFTMFISLINGDLLGFGIAYFIGSVIGSMLIPMFICWLIYLAVKKWKD